MLIDTKNMVSITEANQNFSRVAKMAEENGVVYIMKNNKPLLQINFLAPEDTIVSDEEALALAARLLQRSRKAYEVLAQ